MSLIETLGGYDVAAKIVKDYAGKSTYKKYLIIIDGKFRGVINSPAGLSRNPHIEELISELLEYRRVNNTFEPGDYVFLRDENFNYLYVVTNILDDGRIEIKTGERGYPPPAQCWGLYYQGPEGLRHATQEELPK